MRVFVGPRAGLGGMGPGDDTRAGEAVVEVAHALAGPRGDVISLGPLGVSDLSRQQSAAEVALLRNALRPSLSEEAIVGYVCSGVEIVPRAGEAPGGLSPAERGLGGGRVLGAVTDHVNLTWRSPLTGPNDDSVGPRFPSMTGIYAPETVADRLAAKGIIVVPAIVAGVSDEHDLSAFEADMVGVGAYKAASSELVPVAIVAAHMGLRMAAVVVPAGFVDKKEMGSGRS